MENKFSVFKAVYTAILRSHPQVSRRVFCDGVYDVFRQAVPCRVHFPTLFVPTRQTVLCAGPQSAKVVFKQGKDLRTENPRAGSGLKLIGLKLEQALVPCPGPNLLLTIHQYRPCIRIPAHAEILHGIGKPISHAMRVKSHPQTAACIRGQRLRIPRMKSARRVEIFSFDPIQAVAISSRPQVSLAVHTQRKNKRR